MKHIYNDDENNLENQNFKNEVEEQDKINPRLYKPELFRVLTLNNHNKNKSSSLKFSE
jgi:hypothetical protein